MQRHNTTQKNIVDILFAFIVRCIRVDEMSENKVVKYIFTCLIFVYLTNIIVACIENNVFTREVRRFTCQKHLSIFMMFKKLHLSKDRKHLMTKNNKKAYAINTLVEKQHDTIILTKCVKNISFNDVHRFRCIKDMRKFMSDKKLVMKYNDNKEDKRYMIDDKDKMRYKCFIFENDKHYSDDAFVMNTQAMNVHFDDYIEMHYKNRK